MLGGSGISVLFFKILVYISCSLVAPVASNHKTPLLDVLLGSELLRNLTNVTKIGLQHHLAHIARAPAETRLRTVHELQYGDVGRDAGRILERFARIDRQNLPMWFDNATEMLDKYVHGVWSVQHGSLTVELNQTALSGLPMVRRSLLAQLYLAWLTSLQKDFPAEVIPKLEKLIRQLYDIHRSSVLQKGVMEYFHISKAGGTSWNSAAKLNGCVRAMHTGSHVRGFGDECRWINMTVYEQLTSGRRILWGRWGRVERPAAFQACQPRYEHVRERGFSYTSNEYTLMGGHRDMFDAHVCPHVVNVVTLRNPIKRMESAIRFIMMHVKSAYRRGVPGGEPAFKAIFCNASRSLWEALAPPVADNYIVRSFLGERGFHTPLGGIDEGHVAVAREQLLQFDLVLDLDAGEAANDRMAQQGLGWPAALSRAHALDSSVLAVRMQLNYSRCHPRHDELEVMKQRQAPDMKLYSFGQVVSRLDELWLDMARVLDLTPLGKPLDPDAPPSEIRCGLLQRGSNNSALSRALDRAAVGGPPPDDNDDDDDDDEGDFAGVSSDGSAGAAGSSAAAAVNATSAGADAGGALHNDGAGTSGASAGATAAAGNVGTGAALLGGVVPTGDLVVIELKS